MIKISKATLIRLPLYLNYLKALPPDYPENISSAAIALALGFGEIQVRKDLASVARGGKPKVGYSARQLIADLESFLGYNEIRNAVLVGAGKLGRALLHYSGFQNYGLNILCAFDEKESILGKRSCQKPIFHISEFSDRIKDQSIKIGIITVPAKNAQAVCDLMVENGILAIWNFAPTHLNVPSNILVQNENMAASLALLSGHLTEQLSVINTRPKERNHENQEL